MTQINFVVISGIFQKKLKSIWEHMYDCLLRTNTDCYDSIYSVYIEGLKSRVFRARLLAITSLLKRKKGNSRQKSIRLQEAITSIVTAILLEARSKNILFPLSNLKRLNLEHQIYLINLETKCQ